MNLTEEIKQEVIRLVLQNRKIEASDYLCRTLNIDSFQAGLLVAAVENELSGANQPQNGPEVPKARKGGCLKIGALVVAIVAGLLTLLFLGGAALFYYSQQDTIEKSTLIKGKVIQLVADSVNSTTFAPLIQYEFEGKTYTHQSTSYAEPPNYTTGQEVEIYVNPANPERIQINSDEELYSALYGLLFIGGFFLIFVIIFTIVYRAF